MIEQETRKPITRASARHLRRKRLRDARRAEEQRYLDILNGVNSHIKDENSTTRTNSTTKNSANISDESTATTQEAALKLASAEWNKPVFPHSSVNLSLSDPLNDLTIVAILKKLASLENNHAEQTNPPASHCSSNVVDEAECVNGAEDLSQTTNGKKKKKKRKKRAKSLVAGVTLDEDSLNASSSNSESNISNLNCDSNCFASRLDSDAVENGQVLEQSVHVNVTDSDHSMQNDIEADSIEIKSDQVEMSTTNYCMNRLSTHIANCSSVIGTDNQSDSRVESKDKETNASTSTSPAGSTTKETLCSPAKTREKMSAQHGAKNTAKIKVSKIAQPTTSGNDDIEKKSSTIKDKSVKMEAVRDITTSPQKTNVTADTQNSQTAKKTESKHNIGKNSIQNYSSGTSREEVKTQREVKKAAKTKAKSMKAAGSMNRNNDDVQHRSATASSMSLSKNPETTASGNVAEDSRKAVVVNDTRSSQSAEKSESKQVSEKNGTQSDSTAGSEKSDDYVQKLVSSIKVMDEESSLPEKMYPAADSHTVKETESKQITRGDYIQGDSVTASKSKESNASLHKSVSSIKTSDDKSSLPEKTREDVKAEREAKKSAKAAAKAKAKSKKTENVTDNVKNSTTNAAKPAVTDAQSLQKTDVAVTSSQNPQPIKESEKSFKENISQPPTVQTASVESSVVFRQDSTISDEKSESKSKAELRAERRAKQEAQRAAKQSATKQQSSSTPQQPSSAKNATSSQEASLVKSRAQQATTEIAGVKKIVRKDNDHEVNLFKHLYNERELSLANVYFNSNIHPAIIGLGAQYASRTIAGSNARCIALLAAVKQVIQDFVKPEQTDFTRSLEVCLRDSLSYLHRCRPVAVSMQNAMRHLKWHMTTFPITMSTDEVNAVILDGKQN